VDPPGRLRDGTLLVCLWRQATPATSPPYDFFAGDETGHLLEGRVTVELVESGERIELAAGDVYSFFKGTLSRWIVHEPVTKVAVIAHRTLWRRSAGGSSVGATALFQEHR
jgi:uncharacterized cupin superfamily protein